MDKLSQLSNLSTSFSMHSLAEGSEAISEAEEIKEVKLLQERGKKAFQAEDLNESLRLYNEALEIHEENQDSLSGRAAVYLEQGNYVLALQDVEKLLSINPNYPQAYYLQGVALDHQRQYKESLAAFLKALELDPDHADILTGNIASLAGQFCTVPEEVVHRLPDMDPYKKLCEVGACLFQGKKYETCIKILKAAQKLETNQKGITMKIQLTMGNAYSALKDRELAISVYQDCLTTAVAVHDYQYQTKALVNIASLFLETNDTHQAIVYYEKLLALEAELRGENGQVPLPDFWSIELQCALHLNLSIAYKTIGDIHKAKNHADIYVSLLQSEKGKEYHQAQSVQNLGILNEILGNYTEALEQYKKYLEYSRRTSDQRSIARAYGCMGSIYTTLRNKQLAVTFHEQHIAMARNLTMQDPPLLAIAYEQLGNSYMEFEDYDNAIDAFMQMFHSCVRNDFRSQTNALCKLGNVYRAQERYQYSLYYLEQAKVIAEDFGYKDLKDACEYYLASILQHSTQMFELDQAKRYLEKLIPLYETKIQQHKDEDTFCPQELQEQLSKCYDAFQNVLNKLGDKETCLQYAEAQRRRSITEVKNYTSPASQNMVSMTGSQVGFVNLWDMEKIKRVISQQNYTVLYYTLLPTNLLLWVLQPGMGLSRFYAGRPPRDKTMNHYIKELIADLTKDKIQNSLQYNGENRALPLREIELELSRKRNRKLNMKHDQAKNEAEVEKEGNSSNKEKGSKPTKTAARKLFDVLLAPVYDIISKLEEGSSILVVPDKDVCQVPFNFLQDWSEHTLGDKFHFTFVPSLFLLDKVIHSEINQLRREDDLDFDRSQSKSGGMGKVLAGSPQISRSGFFQDSSGSVSRVESGFGSKSTEECDPKRSSNPRLLKSGLLTSPDFPGKDSATLSREATLFSQVSRHSFDSQVKSLRVLNMIPPRTASLRSLKQLGTPTPLSKMASLHSFGTLTTSTSTKTDIVNSSCVVPEFKQISDPDRCVVIGHPILPERVYLYGRVWEPKGELLQQAQKECFKVADYFDVEAVVGKEATKQRFLAEIQRATVLHIATVGSLKEGLLVMSPNPLDTDIEPLPEASYLVTLEDIVNTKMVARLVVLSSCWSTYRREAGDASFSLPSAFLAAGAQCVLTLLWPVPLPVLDKFFYHFYESLQKGHQVAAAVHMTANILKDDEKYNSTIYWAPYVLLGKDVTVTLNSIRHAMLDQTVDRVEKQVANAMSKDPLNPEPVTPYVSSKGDILCALQSCIAQLLSQHSKDPSVLPQLIDMLDSSLKRLHTEENNRQTCLLADCVNDSPGGLALLKLLGFHFQYREGHVTGPYIVYPHWNQDELLVPAYDALRACIELVHAHACCKAMYELLPAAQENISRLVDVLCITKHAPDIQLKTSDISVRPLWQNTKIYRLLTAIGFQQIGTLLNFTSVPANRRLLTATLQLLISLSTHKTPMMLHKLDVNLLGGPHSNPKDSSFSTDLVKLPSLTPVLLPRNQVRLSTPWLSTAEKPQEMNEKMKLARSKTDLSEDYQHHVERAKTWHSITVSAQANKTLDKIGRRKKKPLKVKVVAGSSSSCERVPIDREPTLSITDVDQRRDYANYLLSQRLDNVALRYRNDVRRLYLPYVQNAAT